MSVTRMVWGTLNLNEISAVAPAREPFTATRHKLQRVRPTRTLDGRVERRPRSQHLPSQVKHASTSPQLKLSDLPYEILNRIAHQLTYYGTSDRRAEHLARFALVSCLFRHIVNDDPVLRLTHAIHVLAMSLRPLLREFNGLPLVDHVTLQKVYFLSLYSPFSYKFLQQVGTTFGQTMEIGRAQTFLNGTRNFLPGELKKMQQMALALDLIVSWLLLFAEYPMHKAPHYQPVDVNGSPLRNALTQKNDGKRITTPEDRMDYFLQTCRLRREKYEDSFEDMVNDWQKQIQRLERCVEEERKTMRNVARQVRIVMSAVGWHDEHALSTWIQNTIKPGGTQLTRLETTSQTATTDVLTAMPSLLFIQRHLVSGLLQQLHTQIMKDMERRGKKPVDQLLSQLREKQRKCPYTHLLRVISSAEKAMRKDSSEANFKAMWTDVDNISRELIELVGVCEVKFSAEICRLVQSDWETESLRTVGHILSETLGGRNRLLKKSGKVMRNFLTSNWRPLETRELDDFHYQLT
ncbi:hypothetical protein HK102_014051 [Quaeritorhiza haematococci]|nr:hypothetical protein HK102_014051 [Quaeritorhiza haematococci]